MVRTFLFAALVVMLLASAALADVTVTGNAVQDNPTSGSSYAQGASEDNSNIHWFVEKSDFRLTSSIPVEITEPYNYLSAGGHSFTPATFQTGKRFENIYLVHFDPVGTPATNVGPLSITFTFSNGEYFIGAILTANSLKSTDSQLGLSGVTYDTGNRRGSATSEDGLSISSDRKTVTVTLQANTDVDELRILTAPEPGTFALFGLGALSMFGYGVRRRRRRRAA